MNKFSLQVVVGIFVGLSILSVFAHGPYSDKTNHLILVTLFIDLVFRYLDIDIEKKS